MNRYDAKSIQKGRLESQNIAKNTVHHSSARLISDIIWKSVEFRASAG